MTVRTPSAPVRLAVALLGVGVLLAWSLAGSSLPWLSDASAQDRRPRVKPLEGWLKSPKEGLAAARKSGKPVLVGTCWKVGVCNSCDVWRNRVRGSDKVKKALERYERVAWLYDGLGGAVIDWTQQHGGVSDDPSAQVFVLSVRGSVMARAPDSVAYTPARLAKWLKAKADAHEKAHPRTAMPFERAKVHEEPVDTSYRVSLPALDEARKAAVPVLLFVGRDFTDKDDEASRARAVASRKFAKRVLDSKNAAEAAKGWRLLKLDRSEDLHSEMAWTFGISRSPALLLFVPGEKLPIPLPPNVTSQSLAFRLKKHTPKK